MSTFKVGDRVRFKSEHRNYRVEGGRRAGDREFTVSRVTVDLLFEYMRAPEEYVDYSLVTLLVPEGTIGAFAYRLELVAPEAPPAPPYQGKASPTQIVDIFTSLQAAIAASGGPEEAARLLMSLTFEQALDVLARHDIRFTISE